MIRSEAAALPSKQLIYKKHSVDTKCVGVCECACEIVRERATETWMTFFWCEIFNPPAFTSFPNASFNVWENRVWLNRILWKREVSKWIHCIMSVHVCKKRLTGHAEVFCLLGLMATFWTGWSFSFFLFKDFTLGMVITVAGLEVQMWQKTNSHFCGMINI